MQTWQTPKEIVWLNGAPGSGKGANTPFILDSRGLNRAVTMSSLLERHEGCQALMQAGELVPDAMVSGSWPVRRQLKQLGSGAFQVLNPKH